MSDSKKEKVNRNGNRRGLHPNSKANLQHNGRPRKDQSILDYIRAKLPDKCDYDSKGRTWLEALADAEMRFALTDTASRRDLFDRLLGKPAQPIEGGGEMTFRIVYDDYRRD